MSYVVSAYVLSVALSFGMLFAERRRSHQVVEGIRMNPCTDCLLTATMASTAVPRFVYLLIFLACVCFGVLILSALDAALQAAFKEEHDRKERPE